MEFHLLARSVAAALAPRPVVACFLELVEPNIDCGARELLAGGAAEIVVVPVLLFAAGHAKNDIPREVAAAVAAAGIVRWSQTPPFACHDLMVALAATRTTAALADMACRDGFAPRGDLVGGDQLANGGHLSQAGHLTNRREVTGDETLLILAGRGSHDAEATAEMNRFGRLLRDRLRASGVTLADVSTGFVAMASPRLNEVMQSATRSACRRIIVQPHLLFQGQLLDEIRGLANVHAALAPRQQWLIAEHLGPDPLLAELIVGLVEAAVTTECDDSAMERRRP